jgi:hypothetical protein
MLKLEKLGLYLADKAGIKPACTKEDLPLPDAPKRKIKFSFSSSFNKSLMTFLRP